MSNNKEIIEKLMKTEGVRVYEEFLNDLLDLDTDSFKKKYENDLFGGCVSFAKKEVDKENNIYIYLSADIHADDEEKKMRYLTGLSCEDHRDIFKTFKEACEDFTSYSKEKMRW